MLFRSDCRVVIDRVSASGSVCATTCCHEVNEHEVNGHEVNEHEVNEHMENGRVESEHVESADVHAPVRDRGRAGRSVGVQTTWRVHDAATVRARCVARVRDGHVATCESGVSADGCGDEQSDRGDARRCRLLTWHCCWQQPHPQPSCRPLWALA